MDPAADRAFPPTKMNRWKEVAFQKQRSPVHFARCPQARTDREPRPAVPESSPSPQYFWHGYKGREPIYPLLQTAPHQATHAASGNNSPIHGQSFR